MNLAQEVHIGVRIVGVPVLGQELLHPRLKCVLLFHNEQLQVALPVGVHVGPEAAQGTGMGVVALGQFMLEF